jgi:hypothetical protein
MGERAPQIESMIHRLLAPGEGRLSGHAAIMVIDDRHAARRAAAEKAEPR